MGSHHRRARARRAAAPSSLVPAAVSSDDASHDALADLYFGPAPDAEPASARASPGRDPHAEQLCAAVADALTLALADARDPALADLVVASVVPRRGSGCLEVTLELTAPRPAGLVQRRVQRAVGWLRAEVAAAIERKRAPELVLVVVPGVTS